MQQIVRKVFQIRDADAAMAAVAFVQLFGFEVAAVSGSTSCQGCSSGGLGTGGWGLAGGLRASLYFSIDLGDAAAKIG